ncbi:MAG: hypothetical protein ACJ8F7_01955 [Gemmataceae bacterium]
MSAMTPENYQLMVHSPVRQWLVGQLDDLLFTGDVPGKILLSSNAKLFTALTDLTSSSPGYGGSMPTFTCCGDFVRKVWRETWRVGGKTPPADYPAPNFYLMEKRLMTWDMKAKKNVDLGKDNGLYPFTYNLAKDSAGPEPGDIYVTGTPHIGFIRQFMWDGDTPMIESYDGGLTNANDGIQFSKKHAINKANFRGWLDMDAALGGDWVATGTPSWAGLK